VVKRKPRAILIAGVLFVCAPSAANGAALTFDDWVLGVLVSTTSPDAHEARTFGLRPSPFLDAHQTAAPPSTSSATYDIEYSQTFGEFLIETSLNALAGPFGTSVDTEASGSIFFAADAPIAITIDAAFNYDLPPASMFAGLSFAIVDLDNPHPVLFGVSDGDVSWTGEGASGTLTLADGVVLPADRPYLLMYHMRVSTSGGPITAFGTGDGYMDFTLDVVPEPSTVLLLLCALPLFRHRRRNADKSS